MSVYQRNLVCNKTRLSASQDGKESSNLMRKDLIELNRPFLEDKITNKYENNTGPQETREIGTEAKSGDGTCMACIKLIWRVKA